MKQRYPQWIDDYAKVVYNLISTHDADTNLPFNGFNFYPLFDSLWVNKIYKAIEKFNGSGSNIEDIIDFLPTHSSMKFNLLELIIDLKTSDTEPAKAKIIIDFFIKVIQERAGSGNLFKDARIKRYENTSEIIKQKQIIKADRALAQEVAKIIAGCGTLSHGLYNDFCTDLDYDTFGPYDVSSKFGDNAVLFVRQFADSKPIDIWPEFENFPYKNIKTYTIYKGVESESHYLGCHMVYKQNLVDNLTHFQVEIDDRFVNSITELKQIRDKILQVASEHYARYINLGFEEHKQIWLWQLCYQFKLFFEKVGIDWRPSEKMIKQVKGKKLVNYIPRFDISFDEFCDKFGINYLKNIYSL